MADLAVGAQQFAILARHLEDAGQRGLRKDLYDAITTAVRPVLKEIRAGLPDHMPDRYAGVLAANLQLSTRKSLGYDPGVRVAAIAPTGKGRRKISRLEAGILAHPLFGDRKYWYDQTDGVTPDFFSGPLEASAPQIREAILAAMHATAEEITRRT